MNKLSLRAAAYSVAAGVFVLDRITKLLIKQHVSVWDIHTIIPGLFNIVHSENPGAAFSFMAESPAQWRTLLLVAVSGIAAIVIAVMLWRMQECSRLVLFGLALILGGALGNEWDRVIHGTVTDFLEVYYHDFRWPAFNVADSAISTGAALVILDMLRHRRAPQAT